MSAWQLEHVVMRRKNEEPPFLNKWDPARSATSSCLDMKHCVCKQLPQFQDLTNALIINNFFVPCRPGHNFGCCANHLTYLVYFWFVILIFSPGQMADQSSIANADTVSSLDPLVMNGTSLQACVNQCIRHYCISGCESGPHSSLSASCRRCHSTCRHRICPRLLEFNLWAFLKGL